MCGRYFFALDDKEVYEELKRKLRIQKIHEFAQQEVFPTQTILVYQAQGNDYIPSLMHWGITQKQNVLINARSDSLSEKRTFKGILNNRCLIPCNGFYEWKKEGNHKQKYAIRRKDIPLFYLAGIFNDQNQCVILTGEAEKDLRKIHERTPLILEESEIMAYLTKEHPLIVNDEALICEPIVENKQAFQQTNLFSKEEEK